MITRSLFHASEEKRNPGSFVFSSRGNGTSSPSEEEEEEGGTSNTGGDPRNGGRGADSSQAFYAGGKNASLPLWTLNIQTNSSSRSSNNSSNNATATVNDLASPVLLGRSTSVGEQLLRPNHPMMEEEGGYTKLGSARGFL